MKFRNSMQSNDGKKKGETQLEKKKVCVNFKCRGKGHFAFECLSKKRMQKRSSSHLE